uniref:transposase n=1 Tax=Anaerosacchariphilus polymeriproducens TaxID=1812858 RepID=UPI001F34CC16|nr:transposase [Anaerosacchariphilus polymeriproducens]
MDYGEAKPKKCNPNTVIKYIGRYLGRPVIATSRIDSYDGENVTFHYNRHEDEKFVTETVSSLDFIEQLIRHIPEKHYKTIRYYGLYDGNIELKTEDSILNKNNHTEEL